MTSSRLPKLSVRRDIDLCEFRPYGNGQQVRVAAVWTRDERNWRISSGLTPSEVCFDDENNRKDMFVPSDVVGYITTGKDGTLCDIYAAVWVKKPGDDDTRLYVGSTSDQETEAQERLKQAKLSSPGPCTR